MTLRILFYGIAALVVLGLLYRLSKRAKVEGSAGQLLKNATSGDLLPKHYRYFPQVCRALSIEDSEYLSRRADPHASKLARRVRRGVGLEFLHGLHDDYRRLDQLARALTALAPTANPQREVERVWLLIRFEASWCFVWVSLWCGMTPLPRLQRLTGLIGAITVRLESALGVWQEVSLSASSADLNA